MDHSFYRSPQLQGAVMGSLLKRSDRPGWIRLGLIYPLFIATAVALVSY